MEKLKDKYRHIINMLAIGVISAAVLLSIGIVTLKDRRAKSERTIVNDDYSLISQRITDSEGIYQNIKVKGETRLYGVSVNLHIFNRVQHGTIFAQLLDKNGNFITGVQYPLTSVLDNTFKGFIFDSYIQPRQDEEYILHFSIQPETAEDKVALWKSEKTYEGFELTENGLQAEGTIALQYITSYVGRDIYKYYAILSGLIIAGLELLYIIVFIKKSKTEIIFAAAALLVGFIFCIFTPAGGGPDEYVHMASSYAISNSILGTDRYDTHNKLGVRRCDKDIPFAKPVEYNAFSFQEITEGLIQSAGADTAQTVVDCRKADIFKAAYMPQALGVTFARLTGMGPVQLVVAGRLFNLLFYIAVVYMALKLMPVFKSTLALVAMLPMSLQLAGNFNYDTFILAMAFLFTGIVFNLSYKKEKLEIKDLIPLTLVLCLLTPVKPIYIVMGLLVYIIPSHKFKNEKQALFLKTAVIAVGVAVWTSINIGSVIGTIKPKQTQAPQITENTTQILQETSENIPRDTNIKYPFELVMDEAGRGDRFENYDPNSDLMPNGDSKYYYSVPYILSNIRGTVKLIINTVFTQSGKYLHSMIGTRLGEIIVVDLTASSIWLMLIIIVLLISVQGQRGVKIPYTGFSKWLGLFVFCAVTGLASAACIMWTPINYEVVFGIQGRYFLPALPLAVMFFNNKTIILTKNTDNILLYRLTALDIAVILNVFMIMCK